MEALVGIGQPYHVTVMAMLPNALQFSNSESTSFDLSYVSMMFSLQASEIAAGKLHAANGPAEPGQAQGEGWVQFTAPRHQTHSFSRTRLRLISS